MLRYAAVAVLGGICVSCTAVRSTSTKPLPSPAVAPFERQIRNAHDAGDGDYQLNRLRQQVAAEPNNLQARLDLSAAYRDRNYPEIALEITRLTAARFPDSGDAELALVRDLHAMKQGPEAIASLDAFLKAHPQTSATFYSWMGILEDESGHWTDGEPNHRKALELTPQSSALHNNLGYNLLMQKRFSDAAGEFQEALKLNPASEIAHNNLGACLAAQHVASQAVANFQSGTDPATAHSNLAAVLIENGNYVEARKEISLALGYNKTHPAALRNLELVSRLDGQQATMPKPSAQTRWQRFKAGFVRIFAGPTNQSKAAPNNTSAAQ